jgi:erythromycin esterase
MRRVSARSLASAAVLTAIVVDTAVGLIPHSSRPRPSDISAIAARSTPIDWRAPYHPSRVEFLSPAVEGASIVALGESLHVTAEFPLARLRLVQFLHEQLGFDVLALEGSVTQAWLAQEYLYRTSPEADNRIKRAQEMAWFKLWNTAQMRELLSYVDKSQRTSRPLYLASFDVQTGASAEYALTPAVLADVFDRLETFGHVERQMTKSAFISALGPVVQCQIGVDGGLGSTKAPALTAIDATERWIEAVLPAVARERPAAHVAALRLIPDSLRDHVDLCEHATTWQKTRDELNADNALMLRDRVSVAHKIILWAHHSHVAFNTTGDRIASMAQHLRTRIGRGIYSIGLFAGAGRFLDVAPLSVHSLPPLNRVGVERLLDGVGAESYFVDLSALPTADARAGWLTPQSSRMEGRWTRTTVLAKDFDGALYIRNVTPGTGMVPDGAFRVLQAFGMVVDHPLPAITGAVVVLGWLAGALTRLVRRKGHGSVTDRSAGAAS